jgi:hypothetical protein
MSVTRRSACKIRPRRDFTSLSATAEDGEGGRTWRRRVGQGCLSPDCKGIPMVDRRWLTCRSQSLTILYPRNQSIRQSRVTKHSAGPDKSSVSLVTRDFVGQSLQNWQLLGLKYTKKGNLQPKFLPCHDPFEVLLAPSDRQTCHRSQGVPDWLRGYSTHSQRSRGVVVRACDYSPWFWYDFRSCWKPYWKRQFQLTYWWPLKDILKVHSSFYLKYSPKMYISVCISGQIKRYTEMNTLSSPEMVTEI